jgi:hypothetical protein
MEFATMRTITLEAIECPTTGETGFSVAGASVADDYMAATNGALMAHDLLEHLNGFDEIGGIGDELEALGAAWYVRGARSVTEDGLAGDVANLVRDHGYKGFARSVPATTECEADGALDAIYWEARRMARRDYRYVDRDERAEAVPARREFFKHARAFLTAGYLHAAQVYGSNYTAAQTFYAVEAAVNRCTRGLEIGQQFTLTIGDGEARCEEFYGDELCEVCEDSACEHPNDHE